MRRSRRQLDRQFTDTPHMIPYDGIVEVIRRRQISVVQVGGRVPNDFRVQGHQHRAVAGQQDAFADLVVVGTDEPGDDVRDDRCCRGQYGGGRTSRRVFDASVRCSGEPKQDDDPTLGNFRLNVVDRQFVNSVYQTLDNGA